MKLAKRLMMGIEDGTDTYWANTVLCINPAGVDDSTAITDATGKTVTVLGTARIKNTLGYPAIYLDGSGASLKLSSHADFALPGDFTLEIFLYPIAWGSNSMLIKFGASGLIQFSQVGTTNAVGVAKADVVWLITGSAIPAINALSYVAVRRAGSAMSLWLNGVQIGSANDATSYSAADVYIGKSQNNLGYLNAYVRGVRITKGVARDVSGTPSLPFPTS